MGLLRSCVVSAFRLPVDTQLLIALDDGQDIFCFVFGELWHPVVPEFPLGPHLQLNENNESRNC